ncbi:MAG: ABC transporter ATP-binding protein [Candidatus Thorarchaeota archaeon]
MSFTKKENEKKNLLAIITKNVKKSYWVGNFEVTALVDVNLTVKEGDFKMILGPSGSGKSTLLNLLGGIDSADRGEILINFGDEFKDIAKFSKEQLSFFRRQKLGIIFQFYNLIPILTAMENVELAAQFSHVPKAKQESFQMLEKLGLDMKKAKRYPNQLSGGEQQRVAIARALVKNPALILADEPTGNLDRARSNEIYEIMRNLAEEFNKTVLIVTHDVRLADKYAKSKLYLNEGKVVEEINNHL